MTVQSLQRPEPWLERCGKLVLPKPAMSREDSGLDSRTMQIRDYISSLIKCFRISRSAFCVENTRIRKNQCLHPVLQSYCILLHYRTARAYPILAGRSLERVASHTAAPAEQPLRLAAGRKVGSPLISEGPAAGWGIGIKIQCTHGAMSGSWHASRNRTFSRRGQRNASAQSATGSVALIRSLLEGDPPRKLAS